MTLPRIHARTVSVFSSPSIRLLFSPLSIQNKSTSRSFASDPPPTNTSNTEATPAAAGQQNNKDTPTIPSQTVKNTQTNSDRPSVHADEPSPVKVHAEAPLDSKPNDQEPTAPSAKLPATLQLPPSFFANVSSDMKKRVETMLNDERFQKARQRTLDSLRSRSGSMAAQSAGLRKKSLDAVVNKTVTAAERAGRFLNETTGYYQVDALKKQVLQKESEFRASQKALEESALKHESASSTRSSLQRELNHLLQRKHAWTDDDLLRFTTLYRREHVDEQSERTAADTHRAAEVAVERAREAYVEAIRQRYHEEQVWSDRVRGAATYGTWALMGVNLLMFLLVQMVLEPRKREKLVTKFEAALDKKSAEDRAEMNERLKEAVTTAGGLSSGNIDAFAKSFAVEAGAVLDSIVNDRRVRLLTKSDSQQPTLRSLSPIPALAMVQEADSGRSGSQQITETDDQLSTLPTAPAMQQEISDNATLVPEIAATETAQTNVETPIRPELERQTWLDAGTAPSQITKSDLVYVGIQGALVGCITTGLVSLLFGR